MNRSTTKKVFFGFILSTFFFFSACTAQKVSTKTRPPSHEKKGVYHVVERHQTLYRICKTYGVDLKEVARLNGIADPARIDVGQRILIPGASKVLKVEVYLEDVAAEPGEREKVPAQKLDLVWPVEGKVNDRFDESESRRHQGVDISAPLGTSVKASATGVVLYSGNGIKGYGNLIILRHSEEWVTVYAHNQVNLVEEGAFVEKGQTIGKVGKTGRATGPHLHFEIRKNNRAVDPLLYLKL